MARYLRAWVTNLVEEVPMIRSRENPSVNATLFPQRLVMAMISSALAMAAGCTPQGLVNKASVQAETIEAQKTNDICVSLEGNGENFSSHIGAFIALMEQGLNPRVVAGGSSGAVIAGLVRALLTNPTLAGPAGSNSVQNAARVLAAGKPVFESLLFLPTLDDIRTAVTSMALTLGFAGLGRGFVSNPDYAVAHAEAIVGQNLIATQFFRDTDFSDVLREPDYFKRMALVQSLWEKGYGFIRVSPAEFVQAMLTPDAHATDDQARQRNHEIRRRYFALFGSPIVKSGQASPEEMLLQHENVLDKTAAFNSELLRSSAVEIYKRAVEIMRPLPFVGALSATVDKPFLLPDPSILSAAIRGLDKNGDIMAIPEGTVIHTTARQGELRLSVPFVLPKRDFDGVDNGNIFQRIDDKPGFKNLYQLYFGNDEMTSGLHKAQMNHAASGLLFYQKGGETVSILHTPQHAQAVGGLNLSQAVSLSISEPGFFRRIPLVPSRLKLAPDSALPAAFLDPETFLISYGGWLDTSASQTLALLPDCDPSRIAHFAFLHPNRLDNEFQKNAVTDVNNRAPKADRINVAEVMTRIREYLVHSRTAVRAQEPSLDLSWNWDEPVGKDSVKNRELKQNRGLYLYAAYTAFRDILRKSLVRESLAPSSFGPERDVNVVDEIQRGTPLNDLQVRIYGE